MQNQQNTSCPLPDTRAPRIDPTLPVDERIRLFLSSGGDPYHFQAGGTPVTLLFDDGAPGLQSCLFRLCTHKQ